MGRTVGISELSPASSFRSQGAVWCQGRQYLPILAARCRSVLFRSPSEGLLRASIGRGHSRFRWTRGVWGERDQAVRLWSLGRVAFLGSC